MRRATPQTDGRTALRADFYPRSPCGERRIGDAVKLTHSAFLSTLSLRRATAAFLRWKSPQSFLSTLSLRRATPRGGFCYLDNIISIHALLAESDWVTLLSSKTATTFLSTLSLRRATHNTDWRVCHRPDFYPRSPCGERQRSNSTKLPSGGHFYPRSPCGERPIFAVRPYDAPIFLSTLSLRRATVHYDNYNLHCVISIHALLAESDQANAVDQILPGHFYPRSPCGERPVLGVQHRVGEYISIHALLAESDHEPPVSSTGATKFLSTLSLRRATFSVFASPFSIFYFYPRSPCGERRYRINAK